MSEGTKNTLSVFLIQLLVLVGFVSVLSGVIMFAWNYGLGFLIPAIPNMSYINSLGITTGGVIVQMVSAFWYKKYVENKKANEILEALKKADSVTIKRVFNNKDAD